MDIPLGARIRAYRESRDFGLREAARMCGIDVQKLKDAEEGSDSRSSTVVAIARGLGLSADYLLGLTDEGPVLTPPARISKIRRLAEDEETRPLRPIPREAPAKVESHLSALPDRHFTTSTDLDADQASPTFVLLDRGAIAELRARLAEQSSQLDLADRIFALVFRMLAMIVEQIETPQSDRQALRDLLEDVGKIRGLWRPS